MNVDNIKWITKDLMLTVVVVAIAVIFAYADETELSIELFSDPFDVWDGPIKLNEIILTSLVQTIIMIGTALLWRVRIRWIRILSRILGGLSILVGVKIIEIFLRCGIGWPAYNYYDNEIVWMFSGAADLCFLVAWISVAFIGVMFATMVSPRILPNKALQRTAPKEGCR
jgi:hypothetical protein